VIKRVRRLLSMPLSLYSYNTLVADKDLDGILSLSAVYPWIKVDRCTIFLGYNQKIKGKSIIALDTPLEKAVENIEGEALLVIDHHFYDREILKQAERKYNRLNIIINTNALSTLEILVGRENALLANIADNPHHYKGKLSLEKILEVAGVNAYTRTIDDNEVLQIVERYSNKAIPQRFDLIYKEIKDKVEKYLVEFMSIAKKHIRDFEKSRDPILYLGEEKTLEDSALKRMITNVIFALYPNRGVLITYTFVPKGAPLSKNTPFYDGDTIIIRVRTNSPSLYKRITTDLNKINKNYKPHGRPTSFGFAVRYNEREKVFSILKKYVNLN